MAHKKAGGSSKNGRDSHSKRLGIKRYGGQLIQAGTIIVRQRGTEYHPGVNVGIGTDHTLVCASDGLCELYENRSKTAPHSECCCSGSNRLIEYLSTGICR